jgi:hypothetical protein
MTAGLPSVAPHSERRLVFSVLLFSSVLIGAYLVLAPRAPGRPSSPVAQVDAATPVAAPGGSPLVEDAERVPVNPDGSGLEFVVRFEDPSQARVGDIVHGVSRARSVPVTGYTSVAVIEPGRVVRIGTAELVARVGSNRHEGEFAFVVDRVAHPFRAVDAHRYECVVPRLECVAVTCQDPGSRAIEGAVVVLSKSAVPKSAVVAGRLWLIARGEHATHARVTGPDGRAQFESLAAGEYCFDVAAPGRTIVDGVHPDRDVIVVPGPDVVVTLHEMHFLVADVRGDELLACVVECHSAAGSAPAAAGRGLALQLQELAVLHPEADVLDGRLVVSAAVSATATLRAVVRNGDSISRVRAELPFRALDRIDGPIVVEAAADGLDRVAAGSVRVDLVDGSGRTCSGWPYSLVPRGDGGSRPHADSITGARCGSEFLAPGGAYSVVFADATIAKLAGDRRVRIEASGSTSVLVEVREAIASIVVRLVDAHGEENLPGCAIRVRQEGAPMRITGGDGETEFGPFAVRSGRVEVEAWAPGYVLARREVEVDARGVADKGGEEVPVVIMSMIRER